MYEAGATFAAGGKAEIKEERRSAFLYALRKAIECGRDRPEAAAKSIYLELQRGSYNVYSACTVASAIYTPAHTCLANEPAKHTILGDATDTARRSLCSTLQ